MSSPINGDSTPDKMEDALKALFETPAPADAFVDQLEGQLRARHVTLTASSSVDSSPRAKRVTWLSRLNPFRRFAMIWQRSRALVSGAAALVALMVLVVGLIALFGNAKQLTTTGQTTPTPAGPLLVLEGSIANVRSPIGSRQLPISVQAPLPELPAQVPLYDIRAAVDAPSAQTTRTWAERLGLKSVRIFQEGDAPGATYVALADDGRSVRVGPGSPVIYQASMSSTLFRPRTSGSLDLQTARAAVEAFLNHIPDLFVVDGNSPAKVSTRVELSLQQAPESRIYGLTFEVTVLIDGIAVSPRSSPNTVFVGADGQIQSATLTPLHIKATGQVATLRPAESVVRAFVSGDQSMLRGSGWGSSALKSDSTARLPDYRTPSFTTNETALMRGHIQHWSAADGGSDLYWMWASGGQAFILDGADLNAAPSDVEIKGRIGDQVSPGVWRVTIISLQPSQLGPSPYEDWTGVIRRQADGVWLETDSGEKYLLPDVPSDISDGERVAAPGVVIEGANGTPRLEWQTMMPGSQSAIGGPVSSVVSSGGGGVAVAVTVAAPVAAPVEPTQVITPMKATATIVPDTAAPPVPVYPPSAPSSVGVFQSITAVSGGPEITPTLPAWWTYKPGDEVTLEGELSAQAYRIQSEPVQSANAATETPARVISEAYLLARKDGDTSGDFVPVTLVGDQVNVDLVRLGGLQVRVQGRLLGPDEVAQQPGLTGKGSSNFGLEVTHYEKLRPDETKDVYSGQVQIETVGGQEVAILSDTLSGKGFVLADSLEYTGTLSRYQQMADSQKTLSAIGIVEADKIFDGRPVLRTLQQNFGSRDPALTIKGLHDQLDNPIQEIGPAPEGPQDVIIDRIELAYVFQTPPPNAPEGFQLAPTELFYQLSGHSSDGRYTVTYDLEATASTQSTVAPPVVVPLTPAPTEPASESATPTLTQTPSPPTLAPPATPGPAPTLEPIKLEGGTFISTSQIAIQLAIALDAKTAVREQPITEEMIAAHPDMVTAKRYATQMETDFGVVTALVNEPVWVVTIYAKGTFNLVDMSRNGPMEADSVSYELLEKTGQMLGLAAHPASQ